MSKRVLFGAIIATVITVLLGCPSVSPNSTTLHVFIAGSTGTSIAQVPCYWKDGTLRRRQ